MNVTEEHMLQAAELVKDYLTKTNYHIAAFNRVMGYIEQLEKENARLKEALSFYASGSHVEDMFALPDAVNEGGWCPVIDLDDMYIETGAKARRALAGEDVR